MTNLSELWETRDDVPPLEAGQVHVWRFPLIAAPEQVGQFVRVLADDERRRAERFLFDRHRLRFRVGRARARELLGRYLGTDAASVQFQYTNLGKPYFEADQPAGWLKFNVTNSADWGLLAITSAHEVGIDIELIRDMSDMEGLAKRFFAPTETAAIMGCPDRAERRRLFFCCWTRKEAFLKAVGKGLTFPLERVCVATNRKNPTCIASIDGDERQAAEWSLLHLEPVAGYVGAVAIQQPDVHVTTYQQEAWTD